MVADLSTWCRWLQIKLYLRTTWRKLDNWYDSVGFAASPKDVLFSPTTVLKDRALLPLYRWWAQASGIHWAHGGLHDAKSRWEVSSWLIVIAGLWGLSFQIMKTHQVRLARSCEMFVGLIQHSSRHHLAHGSKSCGLVVLPLPLYLLFPSAAPHCFSHLLYGTIILNEWYPILVFVSSIPEAVQSLLMTRHQENFRSRWFWHWRFIFFPLLLLASLGQHVAKLCWFLSTCNQAKMFMSKNIFFSFSLKRSSLFSVMLHDRKRVFAWFQFWHMKCLLQNVFYHYVVLSKYYCHCHFQLNSRNVLFVPRIFHILSKFSKGNFKCKTNKHR